MNISAGMRIFKKYQTKAPGWWGFWIDWNAIYQLICSETCTVHSFHLIFIFSVLNWDFKANRITRLQKRVLRVISNSKYTAHDEPLSKPLNLLKVSDIFHKSFYMILSWIQMWKYSAIDHASVLTHDDVIKWKHFPRYWPFVWVIHRPPVNSPHKGQWRGALVFSLICPNKPLSKHSWGWWFETSSRSLWRQCNDA